MAGGGMEPGQASSPSRRRAALAGALVLGALVIAIVIAASSGSSSSGDSANGAQPPEECLRAWNSDVVALNYGVHSSISHGYDDVQVGYMPRSGSALLSNDPDVGRCAVVFAANQLDPERQAAGQIQLGGEWVPLSRLVGLRELAQLQGVAVRQANTRVTEYGKLVER